MWALKILGTTIFKPAMMSKSFASIRIKSPKSRKELRECSWVSLTPATGNGST